MSPPLDHHELLTIQQLSERWKVPKATLYNWVYHRRLPYLKLGRSLRFREADLDTFLAGCTIGVAGKR